MSLPSFLSSTDRRAILLPPAAMAGISVCVLLRLVSGRIGAIASKRVHPKHYKLYNTEGGEPADVAVWNHHLENLFETPVLFYAACASLCAADVVAPRLLQTAWAYVALRVAHLVTHVTYNHPTHRALWFAASVGCIGALWAGLASGILAVI